MRKKTKKLLILLTVAWFACTGQIGFAQKQTTYNGNYSLGYGLKGKANFKYTIVKNDTIKNGLFWFKSTHSDTAGNNSLRSVSYSGNYLRNLKNGPWQYNSKTIQPAGELTEVDNQIVYQTSGQDFLVNANFKNGEATGTWELLERKIKNSVPADTLFYVKAGFKNGRIAGNIEGIFNNIWFSGSISDNGFINGRWVFRPVKASGATLTEYRHYHQGRQTSHYFLTGTDTLQVRYVGLNEASGEDAIWENTPLGSKYFNALESAHTGLAANSIDQEALARLTDTTTSRKTVTNQLLKNVFTVFSNYAKEHFWALTEGGEPVTEVYARLNKVPYSAEEKANLESTNKLLAEANAIFEQVLNNPAVEINRLSNPDLAFYHQLLTIYKKKIAPPNKLIRQFAKPSFEYVNREEILKHVVAETDYPEVVSYSFKDSVYQKEHSFPKIAKEQALNLPAINRHFEQVVADLVRIETKIDALLKSRLRESRLVNKEKLLIQLKDSVINLYANQPGNELFNDFHKHVAENITAYSTTMFTQYAGLQVTQKADTIDAIVECFSSFIKLYSIQAGIPEKLKKLDEAYTRSVWNPFTMSYMQERMKSRIYAAFEEHALPFYLNHITNYNNCGELEQRYQSFDALYERMVELRNQDTKQISRRLRGQNSTEKILEILGLNLNSL